MTTSPTRSVTTAVLCWLTVLLEGYDLVALGATIPTLLKTHHLGFTAAGATAVATVSLVGVAVGAAGLGPLTDRFGRRGMLIGSVLLFSLFTLLTPLAPNVAVFGVLRFAAGLGLGACMPVALTVMSENLPARRRASASTFTMTGYHVGAVLTSILALVVGENWHVLFYGGGAVGLAVVPLMWWRLPESAAYLAAKEQPEVEKVSLRYLLGPKYRRISLAVWAGSFMGLLLVYGLNTWLPQLMRSAGYPISTSVALLLVLNVGAIIGLVLGGVVADRRGIPPIARLWFGAGAVLLAVLSLHIGSSVLLNALVLLTGVFVFSAQVLIYGYVAQAFPARARGTALGLTSAVGRLGSIVGPFITGALVTAGVAYPWGFWFFAAVAVLGLVAVLFLRARTAETRAADEPALQG
ncbi:aromatic acid/H+ symport family MFS transporter [Amycolatopsis acidiphila]|uniref:Aromatic acid/H+ symport family MFS transporter n=1 Tax=Amycolatopsis acidiphila TaxID=715473 RepID=A0A558AG59_9PSEU|nr:aromatic acid/H+ symport family MFS transporter [Amycolatopsis acidiphila]TVT23249.1 aromatic acid/H+ symport family MFS transporter [Amycolatopsis acidiphila]UIJ56466.1 aromatic acid/H+ symport family MFS transporter [Amycolatopsis acidiphila]GHG67101.1 MFS transporter [Amycolatopsis acidiphila]